MDSTTLRKLASGLQDGEIKRGLLAAALRIEELIVQNHVLVTVSAIPRPEHSNEIADLMARVAQLERQLPAMAEIEFTIGHLLKQYGYAPR